MNKIEDALNALTNGIQSQYLANFADANIYGIKMPGRIFVPPENGFIECVIIQNNSGGATWGDDVVFSGVVRLILHVPVLNEGNAEPYAVAGRIAALFPKGFAFRAGEVCLSVTESPVMLDAIETGHENLFPVSFGYRSQLVIS